MAKIQKSKEVGDAITPPLRATESGLRKSADQADKISANQASLVTKPPTLSSYASALKSSSDIKGNPTTCQQHLWLSFFFDGTGNNITADIGLEKHSNIAKLYRAHKPVDKAGGVLGVYVPGIGTYFPEKGDDGGSTLGLGCGSMGDKRLDFALEQFDLFLKDPLSRARFPSNAITEINVAVFGFSRGAALARAFISLLMEKRCQRRDGKWLLMKEKWHVRFRFLGLFDTVASVGLPMSSNTVGKIEAYNEDTKGMIEKRLREHRPTRVEELAFSVNALPGADPSPGLEDGHSAWGARLKIHETVEEVRHFIAAHEIRNSFPLDSISMLSDDVISKPAHFYENVYPGAHSDVGGGYAPGEGARSFAAMESLSLVPLRHMYDHALQCGVPMLLKWTEDNKSDFRVDPELCDTFNYYMKMIGACKTVGEAFNKHMKMYYAWRFTAIKKTMQGDTSEGSLIEIQNKNFSARASFLKKESESLSMKETLAQISLNAALAAEEMPVSNAGEDVGDKKHIDDDERISIARRRYADARDERLRAKARKDSFPTMKNFKMLLSLYDKQLLDDAEAIRRSLQNGQQHKKRSNLRPHYRVLLEAYENEFFSKSDGLKDAKILRFFDSYVHNSLAGFGKDATLPSDPRVVYVGKNEKYKYADLSEPNIRLTRDSAIV